MILKKNKASQKVAFYLEDGSGAAKTGDTANLSVEVYLDGTRSVHTTNIAELDATDHAGVYIWTPPQAQTNGTAIQMRMKSSTAGVIAIPMCSTFRTGPDWDDVFGATFSSSTESLQMLRQMMEDARVAVSRN